MTALHMILKVQKSYSDADPNLICQLINELENRIKREILTPAGIEVSANKVEYKKGSDCQLLLDENYAFLYLFFILSRISLLDGDVDTSEMMAANFNQQYKELEIAYRKEYAPQKNNKIFGGTLI